MSSPGSLLSSVNHLPFSCWSSLVFTASVVSACSLYYSLCFLFDGPVVSGWPVTLLVLSLLSTPDLFGAASAFPQGRVAGPSRFSLPPSPSPRRTRNQQQTKLKCNSGRGTKVVTCSDAWTGFLVGPLSRQSWKQHLFSISQSHIDALNLILTFLIIFYFVLKKKNQNLFDVFARCPLEYLSALIVSFHFFLSSFTCKSSLGVFSITDSVEKALAEARAWLISRCSWDLLSDPWPAP